MAEVTNLNIEIDRDLKEEADISNTKDESIERRRAAMQEIRDLLADLDGNSIDLDQMRAERLSAKG